MINIKETLLEWYQDKYGLGEELSDALIEDFLGKFGKRLEFAESQNTELMKILDFEVKDNYWRGLKYKPLKGRFKKGFDVVARCLNRPYYPITDLEYSDMDCQELDFIEFEGKICTYGQADGIYQITPFCISAKELKKIGFIDG